LVPRPIGMRQRRKLRRLHGATRVLREAVDYFVFRIRRKLSGLAAVLQGIDAIVFCGGIGENAWRVRERVLERAEWLGVELDREANEGKRDIISFADSRARVFVIPTDCTNRRRANDRPPHPRAGDRRPEGVCAEVRACWSPLPLWRLARAARSALVLRR
jgi:hypothetical protein